MSTTKKALQPPTVQGPLGTDLKEISIKNHQEVFVVITGLANGKEATAYFKIDKHERHGKGTAADGKPIAIPLTRDWYNNFENKTATVTYVADGETSPPLEIKVVA